MEAYMMTMAANEAYLMTMAANEAYMYSTNSHLSTICL